MSNPYGNNQNPGPTERFTPGKPQTEAYSQINQPAAQYRDSYADSYDAPRPEYDQGQVDPFAKEEKKPPNVNVDWQMFAGGVIMSAVVAALLCGLLTWISNSVYNMDAIQERMAEEEWLRLDRDWVTASWIAALAAIAAGVLLLLLAYIVPMGTAGKFFSWIGLIGIIGVTVIPILSADHWQTAIGDAVAWGVTGICITSMITMICSKTITGPSFENQGYGTQQRMGR